MLGLALAASAVAGQPDTPAPRDAERTVVDGVPIVGGDSDIGWGGGFVGAITHFAPGAPPDRANPWQWRIEASSLATFRFSPGFGVPYQDHWVQLIVPGLAGGKVRLQTRVAFTQETEIDYFGIGNATPAPAQFDSPAYWYERTHPMVEGYARFALPDDFYAIAGGTFALDWLRVPAGTKLAQDMASASPEVRSLLGDARDHAVLVAQESVGRDTRDNEIVPRRGTWSQLDLRISPALGPSMPYAYAEVLAVTRAYVPIGPRVVVALRALGDGLFGHAPFYQLAEYEDTYAIGGTSGVRGVPAQRYYGKAKIIGNAEVRTDVADFHAIGKAWGVDVVGFFDAGRVWADWASQPQLDGTGLGLKWGTGLGLRLRQGTTFVVRGDVAWSPDAQPIGGYFAAGETF